MPPARKFLVLVMIAGTFWACRAAQAQNNSLYQARDAAGRQLPLTMQQSSLVYSAAPEARAFQVQDIIQVRVDEMARMTSQGRNDQRKNASFNAILNNWIRMNGFRRLEVDEFDDGNPQVRGSLQETYRAENQVETTERLTLNIASTITDIRPNGNLVIEGHKDITINDITWRVALSGSCRQQDIGRDNTITSDRVIDFKLAKHEAGTTRDAYRRGWFKSAYDRWAPF
ncbi:MAG: flagellar basal body L-ring protein FlgH [Planctomycetaceae bacterium]|nr:flagellar basal body L-ring protein FlgH [Planctomycetaceae bacterium]